MDWIISKNQTLTASLHWAPHTIDYVGLNYLRSSAGYAECQLSRMTATILHRWSLFGGMLQSTLAETSVSSDVDPQAYSTWS